MSDAMVAELLEPALSALRYLCEITYPLEACGALLGTGDGERIPWRADLAVKAVEAFFEDHGREPKSWNDQKEWNEKYLKPLIFFHLGNAVTEPEPMNDEEMSSFASQAAARLQADRGTAVKQLARYFERFGR